MLNQIFLYVAYGLGGIFLIGGIILMVGILKPSSEQAEAKKAAKIDAAAAKKQAKEEKKTVFGATKNQKDFFSSNDIGEGGNAFLLNNTQNNKTTTQPENNLNTAQPNISAPNFTVPVNNTPPKNSFQAAAFAAKQGNPTPQNNPSPVNNINIPDEELSLPQPTKAAAPKLPPTNNKSVFGGGDFKLADGSDKNDNKEPKNKYGLPF